jgi:3-oxoacyl-[acyl-carrier protein] reductase
MLSERAEADSRHERTGTDMPQIDTARGPLAGRIAVVTAAAGMGIGGSIARRLHADGARVVVSDAHAGRLERIRAELGIAGDVVDVTDTDSLPGHLRKVLHEHGRIDILVNCAGANVVKPTWELSDEEWQHVFDVNVTAAFRAARAVMPAMIDCAGGSIINIASIAAWDPAEQEIAYAASKAALIGFTRALAREVAAKGVRVNAVAPSFVENPFLEKLYGPERMRALRASAPLGRGVKPEEVAGVVAWLASDESVYVTGETITIAGGSFFRQA